MNKTFEENVGIIKEYKRAIYETLTNDGKDITALYDGWVGFEKALSSIVETVGELERALETIVRYDPTPNYQGAMAQQALTKLHGGEENDR